MRLILWLISIHQTIDSGNLINTAFWKVSIPSRGYRASFETLYIGFTALIIPVADDIITGAAEPGGGGNGGMCPPTFQKRAKVPEKSISWMNALFCWKESALFSSSKDSVKAISDVIETPYFRSARERHKIVWFWLYTKVPLLANAPPLSKCFCGLYNLIMNRSFILNDITITIFVFSL
jgi:hypothetical protein